MSHSLVECTDVRIESCATKRHWQAVAAWQKERSGNPLTTDVDLCTLAYIWLCR